MARREVRPSASASIAAGIIGSLLIIAYGVLLILAGVGALPVDIKLLWLPALLATVGLAAVMTGALRKENVPVWLGVVALTSAVCVALAHFTEQTFRYLYPIFIAAPAVGSLAVLFCSRAKKSHLISIIFFGGMSIIFALKAYSLIKTWLFVVGIVVVMIGLIAFVIVATSKKGRWDDGDVLPKPKGRKWDDGDEVAPTTQAQSTEQTDAKD